MKISVYYLCRLECLLEKIDTCGNNPEESYTKKNLSINLQVTHELRVVHSINQKLNLIIIEEKTVWKTFVKI